MKQQDLLVVEDMETNRIILRELFKNEYHILEAANGVEAIQAVHEHADTLAAVLLDIVMPVMNGFDVLYAMKRQGYLDRIPVIVITGMDALDGQLRAMDLGAVDLISKPFEPLIVRRRVQNAIDSVGYRRQMESMVAAQKQLISQSHEAMLNTLRSILNHKNMAPAQYIEKMGEMTGLLLTEISRKNPDLGLTSERIQMISNAAMFYDIGKIMIPDQIQEKKDRLTEEEFRIMKTHTTEGSRLLRGLSQIGSREFLRIADDICQHHHERFDGSGYPEGISGQKLSLNAQVVGLIDAFEALVTDKEYKPAFTAEEAAVMILNGECGGFSPVVIEAFRSSIPAFVKIEKKYRSEVPAKDDKGRKHQNNDKVVDILSGYLDRDAGENIREPLDTYRYYSLLQYLNASVFEINLSKDTYEQVYPTYLEFSEIASTGRFSGELLEFLYRSVQEEERTELIRSTRDAAERLRNGENTSIYGDYHFYNRIYRVYHRYRFGMLPVYLGNPANRSAVLILKNEDREEENQEQDTLLHFREENSRLRKQAETDYLTGLKNRSFVEQGVKEIIERSPKGLHAAMIIDIDNFKQVNDTAGHLAGDKLLVRFANLLKEQVRRDDITGRIGGDEFFVFMGDIPGVGLSVLKAEHISEELQHIVAEEREFPKVTLSIGISFYPAHGSGYRELFASADKALYVAKNMGKNQTRIFDPRVQIPDNAETKHEANPMEGLPEEMDLFNLRLPYYFYEARNAEEAAAGILDMTARYYDLSDVIVIDGGKEDILYQWSAHKQKKFSGQLLHRISEAMKQGRQLEERETLLCDEDNNIRLSDILHEKAVEGLRLGACLTYDSRYNPSYAAGFIQSRTPHDWTNPEKEALEVITELIARAQTQKAQDKNPDSGEKFGLRLFRSTGVHYYAADATYRLIHPDYSMNDPKPGQQGRCYEVLYGRDRPCDNCPAKHLSVGVHSYTAQVFDPGRKDTLLVTANIVGWESGQVVCLMKREEVKGPVKRQTDV